MASSSAEPMAMPEPMNASPHHSKVKVSITLADRLYVAGGHIGGKLAMECRADKGLGVGVIMIELFATQELSSRDHSATSTFIHSKRIFQGPGLPPSNAVQAHPLPGDPVLPPSYYQARRGQSTFLFRIPIPEGSPSSINFGSGLAKVRYELRATVGVVWKGERRLVVDKQSVDVVAGYPYDEIVGLKEPEGVIIGENGKLWVHGKLVGPVIVAGESACIELHVKNHSSKKNTGLSLSLNRTLILPGTSRVGMQALELTDTLTHVPFRGPEYIVPPGAEGVANLVFDVPKHSRGVRPGTLEGDEVDPPRHTESLFEVRCTVDIKMTMGFGNKDLMLSVPVSIVHPRVVPLRAAALGPAAPYTPQQLTGPYGYEIPYTPASPHLPRAYTANPPYPLALPVSPAPPTPQPPLPMHHLHNQQPWNSPMLTGLPPMSPQPFQSYSPDIYSQQQHQLYLQPQQLYPGHHPGTPQPHTYMAVPPIPPYLVRPASAGGNVSLPDPYTLPAPIQSVSGLPPPSTSTTGLAQMRQMSISPAPVDGGDNDTRIGAEEGKGQRALRVSHHLRVSSRTRSVSPQSHRFPILPGPGPGGVDLALAGASRRPFRGLPQPPSQPPLVLIAPAGVAAAIAASPLSPTMREENGSLSPGAPRGEGGVVHSPRPQLTPKHSFSHDALARPKSERVEELERMATIIALQTKDLSGDIPRENPEQDSTPVMKGAAGKRATERRRRKGEEEGKDEAEMNKTLPPPPVPTRNKPLNPLSRSRLDTLFDPPPPKPELHPSDLTPRTPTLSALLPTRYPRPKLNNAPLLGGNEKESESGLDALERKLLAQVGTRNLEDRERKPDVRYVMGVGGSSAVEGGGRLDGKIAPIDIPTKIQSPEPLNDSAISSLTLGNNGVEDALENEPNPVDGGDEERNGLGVGGNDSDVDVEARTHRGGSVSGDGGRKSWSRLDFSFLAEDHDDDDERFNQKPATRHKREEGGDGTAFRASTPTKLSNGSGKSGKSRERRSGKKKERVGKEERTKTRSEAKGRVAAWLGRIDPVQPPEEAVIPSSPSVARHPEHAGLGDGDDVADVHPVATESPPTEEVKIHEEKDVSAAPNPRSSGFMPVGTLRRETVQKVRPARDNTAIEESKKVADLWAAELPRSESATTPSLPKELETPKISIALPASSGSSRRPVPSPSVRADRGALRASTSKDGTDIEGTVKLSRFPALRSHTALTPSARNVWQLPEAPALSSIKSKDTKSPPAVPAKMNAIPARLQGVSLGGHSGDPEVKYDVRSARGGRGGQVTSVAAMWASVSAGISTSQQSQGGPAASRKDVRVWETKLNHNGRFAAGAPSSSSATKSGPYLPGKIALPGLTSAPVAIQTPKSPGVVGVPRVAVPVPSRTTDLSKPKPSLNHSEQHDDDGKTTPSEPLLGVPKKLSATRLHLPKPAISSNKSKSTESLKSSPAPGLFAGEFKSRTPPGKITPTNSSTPSSSGGTGGTRVVANKVEGIRGGPNPKVNGGNGRPPRPVSAKPDIKSASVPAVISSSHAVPVLSSTASLARPATAAPRLAPNVKTNNGVRGSGNGRSGGGAGDNPAKVVSSGPLRLAAVGEVSVTLPPSTIVPPLSSAKSPPPDLAFGQARLRDLIKKYQTQAS